MSAHKCVIGFLYDYDNTREVTFDDICKYVDERKELYEAFKDDPIYKNIAHMPKPVSDYCDLRKSRMRHFAYCPDCGKKVDWKKLRELANTHEKEG